MLLNYDGWGVKKLKNLTEQVRAKILESIISELELKMLDFKKLETLSNLLDVVSRTPACISNEKTANIAQEALSQLLKGKKTINQIREELGLNPINEVEFNQLITKE